MTTELAINVIKNTKKIKVNEAGEYLVLNFDDQEFIPRLMALINDVENMAQNGIAQEAELNAMSETNEKEFYSKITAKANYDLKVCRELKEKIDATFQDEVCRKVFGNIVPSVALYAEFFAQLKTVIIGFAEESKNKIRKHTEKYHE